MRFGDGGRSGRAASGIGMVVLALGVAAWGAPAQEVSPPNASVQGSGPKGEGAEGRTVRELTDPHTGKRWLLISNGKVPAGPGRMVIAAGGDRIGREAAADRRPAVIHAGDKVVIEEHTETVEAYLDAVALEAAASGSALKVRLKIGSRVVGAVAIAPGRVAPAP